MFTVVNVSVLVLRKDKVEHEHFRAPTVLPIMGALSCAYLVGPWTGRSLEQYWIAATLLAIGLVLGVIVYLINKRQHKQTRFEDPDELSSRGPRT